MRSTALPCSALIALMAMPPATIAADAAAEAAPYAILGTSLLSADAVRRLDDGLGARLGYGFPVSPALSVELGLQGEQAEATAGGVRAYIYGADLGLRLRLTSEYHRLSPFLLLGGGYQVTDIDGSATVEAAQATLGLGLRWALSSRSALRAEARRQAVFSDEVDPARDRLYDSRVGLGIEYAFAEPAVPPPPRVEPVLGFTPAAPALPDQDLDGDGVADARDRCPGSLRGTAVDRLGCALPPPDADRDGVLDNDDRCAATPSGLQVDPAGCAVQAQTLVLRNIGFALDSAVLDPQAVGVLDSIAAGLRGQPGMALLIAGHTDDRGSSDYNQRLSQARAAAVRDYLIGQGIAATRLQAEGYGESRPVADNLGEEGWALNRRVEFRVIAQ